MTRSARAATVLPLMGLLCGCYRYIPAELAAAPVGEEVRVFVSRRGLADVPEGIPITATYLSGRLSRVTTDSMLLQVPVSRRLDAPGALDLRQNVLLPTAEIVELQRRELSRPRTIVALAGGAATAGLIIGVVMDAGGTSEEPTGGGEDQIRIPLLP